MRTLHEIMSSELALTHPYTVLDTEFDDMEPLEFDDYTPELEDAA